MRGKNARPGAGFVRQFCVLGRIGLRFFMKLSAWLGGPLCAWCVLAGCASPLGKARHENASLTQAVDQLRSESLQRERKLRALEKESALAKAAATTSGPRVALSSDLAAGRADGVAPSSAMPELAVTALAPASETTPNSSERIRERVVGVSDYGSEIVYADDAMSAQAIAPDGTLLLAPVRRVNDGGSPHSVRPVPVAAVMARVRAPLRPSAGSRASVPRVAMPPGPPVRTQADAVAQYREGVARLRSGEHAAAIALLRGFLAANPRHDYADNAQYRLAEAFYDQKDYARAATEFRYRR